MVSAWPGPSLHSTALPGPPPKHSFHCPPTSLFSGPGSSLSNSCLIQLFWKYIPFHPLSVSKQAQLCFLNLTFQTCCLKTHSYSSVSDSISSCLSFSLPEVSHLHAWRQFRCFSVTAKVSTPYVSTGTYVFFKWSS